MTLQPAESEQGTPDPEYRISVDTGGTFTDGFVMSARGSVQVKVDSTPYDPTIGFGECIAAAAAGVGEDLVAFLSKSRLIHFSSTIATNAVIQSSGARVGLIVTAGNETELYGNSTQAGDLRGFLPEHSVRGVSERVDADGLVVHEPDGSQLELAVRELLELGTHVLVVSFANAHLNPANEARARAVIETSYPKHYLGAIPLLLSSQVSLNSDDHGRTALAVANAYLHPTLARSLYRAEDLVREKGFNAPLLIVNTDGSSTRVSKTRAIDTFNSGPSAGVLGAAIVAERLQAEHVVTFDVGGTTTDVAYIRAGRAARAQFTDFGQVRIPHAAVDLWSFGIGGGSLITRDARTGEISVGPNSAGAVPGPACFGLGGDQVTPTDVWLALGYLRPGEFLSGRRRLDADMARGALAELANALGVTVDAAALQAQQAIRQALGLEMRRWAQRHQKLDAAPRKQKWLFSYGGGGGLLCVDAAEALGIDNIAVFAQSSVFSAFGGGLLPIAHDYHATVANCSDSAAVGVAAAGLIDRARRDLRAEGIAEETASSELHLVSFTDKRSQPLGPSTLGQLIEQATASPSFRLPNEEVGRISLSVRTELDVDLQVRLEAPAQEIGATRPILTEDGATDVPIAAGLGTPNAKPVTGPAFLSARDTTIFVPAQWRAEFNELGYGLLRRTDNHG